MLSFRAAYIPGCQNQGADILSRQGIFFASQETSHCPLWFTLTHPASLGLDVMVQIRRFSPDRSAPGSSGKSYRGKVHLTLMALWWPAESCSWNLCLSSTALLGRFRSGETFCPRQGDQYFNPVPATYHIPLGNMSLGRDPLITHFLHGTLKLRPVVCTRVHGIWLWCSKA